MSGIREVLSRVGFHAVYEGGIVESVDLAVKHGFSSVQIDTLVPTFFPEKYDLSAHEKIRDYAVSKGVMLKVHAPGEDFSLRTLHSSVQDAVIERQKEVIDFAGDIGARLVTLHPGGVPVFGIPGKGNVPIDVQFPKEYMRSFEKTLRELSSYSRGKTLFCLENAPFTDSVMKAVSRFIEEDLVFLAWDLAHMYRSNGAVDADVERFFLQHLDKIRECHLHDKNQDGSHQVIGTGFVDFKHYLALLAKYPVEYTIEVRPIKNAVRSLIALKKLIA